MTKHLTLITEIDAKGGPVTASMGGDRNMRTSTRAGRFVIYSLEKHISPERYGLWSGIPWGTPMRLTNGKVEVQLNGAWKLLTSQKKWSNYTSNQSAVTEEILQYYKSLKYNNAFPDRWVFNDFGHISIKYFKDINGDRKLNGRESIMGDFIHTTPVDEARTAQNLDVSLSESHGCIHLKPADIDTLIKNDYLKRGNTIEVHSYLERTIPRMLVRSDAHPFFEFHFFPGLYKAAIYRVV